MKLSECGGRPSLVPAMFSELMFPPSLQFVGKFRPLTRACVQNEGCPSIARFMLKMIMINHGHWILGDSLHSLGTVPARFVWSQATIGWIWQRLNISKIWPFAVWTGVGLSLSAYAKDPWKTFEKTKETLHPQHNPQLHLNCGCSGGVGFWPSSTCGCCGAPGPSPAVAGPKGGLVTVAPRAAEGGNAINLRIAWRFSEIQSFHSCHVKSSHHFARYQGL